MAKKEDKKAVGKAADKGVQMSTVLEAPKPDKDRAPREDNIGKKDRRDLDFDINASDPGVDKVYGVASRARWGGNDDIHTLHQDAAAAEKSAEENRE